MKAAVVTAPGETPQYREFREPEPQEGEEIVSVLAAAVHRIVRSRAAGQHYSSGTELPLVPGVDAVALTADGRRVYTGGSPEPFGTLAERAPVPAGWAVPVPDALDDARAAAVVNPGTSSWLPLADLLGARSAVGAAPATVLVHGATGVSGLLAVQVAQVLGAGRVVAAGRNPVALATARDRGADAVVHLDEDLPAQLADAAPDGVDVVVDYLWGERTAALLPALLRAERGPDRPLDVVEIGTLAGADLTLPGAWLRSRPLRLRGSGLGSVGPRAMFAAAAEVLDATARGDLTIDVESHPLADVARVWDTPGRMVLVP